MATNNDSKRQRRAAGETKVTARDALAMLQSAAHYAVAAGVNLRSRTQTTDSGEALVIVVRGARQVKGVDGLIRFELITPAATPEAAPAVTSEAKG